MYYLDLVSYGYARLKAYPAEIIVVFIEKIIALSFLLIFWSLIIKESRSSITIRETLSYFLIIQGLSTLFFIRSQKFGSMLRKNIKSGEISNFLIKPVNVVFSMYATAIGEKAIEGFIALLLLVVGILMDPPQSAYSLLLFLVFALFSAFLGFAFNLFEGVMTFYTTEPSGIMNMVSHVSNVFSGFWIPLMFFPSALRSIVELTPFPWMLYAPYQSLHYTEVSGEILRDISIALFWVVFLMSLLLYFWKRGLKHYEAVGI